MFPCAGEPAEVGEALPEICAESQQQVSQRGSQQSPDRRRRLSGQPRVM